MRPQQRILDELLRLEGWKIQPADKTQLALWCEVSPTSGGYFNNLGKLRSSGLIEYPNGGTVALTEEGRAIAREPEPMTQEEMREAIYARVGSAKAAILRALVAQHPESISKDELADAVEVSRSSGGYFNNLGALRTLGLLDYPSPGRVIAKSVLFLRGEAVNRLAAEEEHRQEPQATSRPRPRGNSGFFAVSRSRRQESLQQQTAWRSESA